MQISKAIDYTLLGIEKGGRVYADLDNGIVKVIWNGKVDLKSAKGIFKICKELVEEELCHKMLLDRNLLISFSHEAKQYLEESFIANYKTIKEKVVKIAAICSSEFSSDQYTITRDRLMKELQSTAEIKEFDQVEEADQWALGVA